MIYEESLFIFKVQQFYGNMSHCRLFFIDIGTQSKTLFCFSFFCFSSLYVSQPYIISLNFSSIPIMSSLLQLTTLFHFHSLGFSCDYWLCPYNSLNDAFSSCRLHNFSFLKWMCFLFFFTFLVIYYCIINFLKSWKNKIIIYCTSNLLF